MKHVRRMLGLGLLLASPVFADVTLELTTTDPSPTVGTIVPVTLEATQVAPANGVVCAIQVVLNWDPALLTLVGANSNGTLPIFLEGFLNSSPLNLDGFADGDGYYEAFFIPTGYTVPGTPVAIVDFQFQVIAATSPTTTISIVASQGGEDTTVLECAVAGGSNVVGTTTNVDLMPVAGPPTVPTVSEWGLILMTLLGLGAGVNLFARKRMLAGVAMSASTPLGLFQAHLFAKLLMMTLAVACVGIAVTILVAGAISAMDVSGTLFSAVLVAYIAQAWLTLRGH